MSGFPRGCCARGAGGRGGSGSFVWHCLAWRALLARNVASAPSSVAALAPLDSVRVTGNAVSAYPFRHGVRVGPPKGPAESPLRGICRAPSVSRSSAVGKMPGRVLAFHSPHVPFRTIKTFKSYTAAKNALPCAGSCHSGGGRAFNPTCSEEADTQSKRLRASRSYGLPKGRYAPAAVSHMLGCCPTSAARSRETLWLLRSSSGDSS